MIEGFKDQYFNNQSKFIIKDFLKIFLICYIPLKLIIVTFLIYFVPIFFSKDYFSYPDFISNYTYCDLTSPNLFFNLLVCSLEIKSISSPLPIIISFFMNTLKDFGFLMISLKFISKRYVIIFLFLIIFHPYLNLYQAKLTTDIFGSFAVFLIFYVITSNTKRIILWDFFFIIFTGFRNSLLIIFLYYYLHRFCKTLFYISNFKTLTKNLLYFIGLLTLFLIITQNDIVINIFLNFFSSRNFNVLNYFIATNIYNINVHYFAELINSSIIILDYFVSVFLLIFVNLILLMGFREAAFTTFPYYFFKDDIVTNISIMIGLFMFSFHLFGLYNFIKYFVKIKPINLCFIFFILFHLLTISHLRYFLPIIPLTLIGLVKYLDELNNS